MSDSHSLAASADSPPQLLMYVLADLSSRRHGSCNVAMAQRDQTGVVAADESIFDFMIDALRKQPPADPPWHELDPAEIADRAAGQILDETSLAAPPTDVEELRRAHRELLALQLGKASRFEGRLRDMARQLTGEAVEQVASAYSTAAAQNPLALGDLARRGLERLGDMAPTPVEERALGGLAAIGGALDVIEARPGAIPAHKRTAVTELLLAEGHVQIHRGCTALAAKEVAAAVGRRTVELAEKLRRSERTGRQAEERLAEIGRRLAENTAAHRRLRSAVQTGGRVWLDGPSSEAVLTGMSQSCGLPRAELVAEVFRRYVAELTRLYPTTEPSGIAAALAALATHECLAAFLAVLQPLLKQPPFYEAVAEYGPEKLADDLFAVAAPLVYLERASELLNVELTEVATATLPAPREASEAEVVARVRSALQRRHGMQVNVVDGADEAVSVVRTLNGFSAAMLADNDVLARAYVDSLDIDHHPHLFEEIADAPDGRASELVVELVHQLDKERN